MLKEWKSERIGDFTSITSGGTPSTLIKEYWNGDIPWMNSGELNNKKIYNVKGKITKLGYNNSSTHMIPKECVLIGLAGQGKTRGTAAINYIELCINQSIGAIFPSKNILPKYLYFYMDYKYKELRELSSGDGGRGGLNLKLLNNFKIEYPKNIEEQNSIVNVLSNIDNLIDLLQETIEKKKKIRECTITNLFNHKNKKSKLIFLNQIGYTYSGLSGMNASNFSSGNKRYITFLNILNNPIVKENLFERFHCENIQNKVQKGDLFFNTSSETPEEVAMCATIDYDVENVYLNSFCFGFRIIDKSVNNKYLTYFFRSQYGRNIMKTIAQGSTRFNLPKEKFLNYKIQIPEDINRQIEVTEILSNMDNEIEKLNIKLNKYKLIKEGMMEDLLTGKVRLNYE